MKQLPPSQNQMASRLQQAVATGDITAWEQTIEFGYRLIDTMYRPDPIKRPFDLFRRQKAYQWWDQQVRLTGQKMGLVVLDAQLEDFRKRVMRPLREEEEAYAEQRDWDRRLQQHERNKAWVGKEAELRTLRNEAMRPIEDEEQDHIEERRRKQQAYEDQRQQEQQRAEDKRERKRQEAATALQIKLANATAAAQAQATMTVLQQQASMTTAPDPNATIKELMKMMAEIEQDPTLDDEQRRRRLDLLKWQFNQLGGGR